MSNKDTHQIDAMKNKRRKKLGETNALKSSKDGILPPKENKIKPYDERARKKEKGVAVAAVATVLAELGIVDHSNKKQRKATKEDVLDKSHVAPVKEEKNDKKKSRSLVEHTVVGDKTESSLKKREEKKVKNTTAPRTGTSTLEEEPGRGTSEAEKGKSTGDPTTDFDAASVERALTPDDRSKKTKKDKKRKLAESLSIDSKTNDADDAEAAKRSMKKKKRSSKLNIIDPSEDKTLSEQALKALIYAFSEYQTPAEWKFSKAKQNWLIRNIWSSTMIPDEHIPLLLWYLGNVKGGVRNALIKTCQDRLRTPEDPANDESVVPAQTDAESTTALFGHSEKDLKTPSDNVQETKRRRAKSILEVLEEQ